MDKLFLPEKERLTRWVSFENPLGEKGRGGMENRGAKGRPYGSIEAGASLVLMRVEGRDYTILPRLEGEGKFIGVGVGVKTNPGYDGSWFGEGEVKIYLDGDETYPTLCGTGTEDYIGTAWGQNKFINMNQGCLISDSGNGLYSFYRFHHRDPVCFYSDITVQIQVMGGAEKNRLLKIIDNRVPVEIVSNDGEKIEHLYGKQFVPSCQSPQGWYNYFREDDFSSTAYFYYNKPAAGLPALPPLAARITGLPRA